MKDFKFQLAGWLCRVAVWLRGEKWYVAHNMAGVPGNRVAELEQNIWEQAVILHMASQDNESLNELERNLEELAQMAGSSWGHVWPKEPTPSQPSAGE